MAGVGLTGYRSAFREDRITSFGLSLSGSVDDYTGMNHDSPWYNITNTRGDEDKSIHLPAPTRKQTSRISHKSSTRYFFLVVTVVTSTTVVPKPSSSVSVVRWEQAQQRFPVFASYGGAEQESLGCTEDEDGCGAKSSTLTGISSQILHGSSLPLSITWTWFEVVCQLRSARMCRRAVIPDPCPVGFGSPLC